MKSTNETGEHTEVAVEIAGHDITWSRVRDILCSAFEGGSNYWYQIDKFVPPTANAKTPWPDSDIVFKHLDYPVRENGALFISSLEEPERKDLKPVNRETIIEGLKVMAKDQIQHFADMVRERDDATTGDVLLQCIVFGEVIYG